MILILVSDILSPFAQHFFDDRRIDDAIERQIRFPLLVEHGLHRFGQRPGIIDQQLGIDRVGFQRDLSSSSPKNFWRKGTTSFFRVLIQRRVSS